MQQRDTDAPRDKDRWSEVTSSARERLLEQVCLIAKKCGVRLLQYLEDPDLVDERPRADLEAERSICEALRALT